jgi:hypothetical protein
MHVFICLGFINYAVSTDNYTASNVRMVENNALEGVRLESVVAYFVLLSQHVPGETEENYEISWLG